VFRRTIAIIMPRQGFVANPPIRQSHHSNGRASSNVDRILQSPHATQANERHPLVTHGRAVVTVIVVNRARAHRLFDAPSFHGLACPVSKRDVAGGGLVSSRWQTPTSGLVEVFFSFQDHRIKVGTICPGARAWAPLGPHNGWQFGFIKTRGSWTCWASRVTWWVRDRK